jgi:hypothetical protein
VIKLGCAVLIGAAAQVQCDAKRCDYIQLFRSGSAFCATPAGALACAFYPQPAATAGNKALEMAGSCG